METRKRIYNKLADKVELSAEKIELSVVDDVRDAAKRGRKIQKELQSDLIKYNGLLRAGDIMNKKLGEVEKLAKELGIKPPAEFKKLQEMADEMLKQGNALKKVYNLF